MSEIACIIIVAVSLRPVPRLIVTTLSSSKRVTKSFVVTKSSWLP